MSRTVSDLCSRWSLTLDAPFERDVSCAWVAPGSRSGAPIVLKIGMPHMEAEDEIIGLRFWDGDPTIRLLDADDALGAMLLERCEPGDSLRGVAEVEQDGIIAALLRKLWSRPARGAPFRPLHALISHWREETLARSDGWEDSALVREGLGLMQQLAGDNQSAAPLATDLHAGNVLRAKRVPWLVIDPKPFVGDPAFDATQHLLNCRGRLMQDVMGTVRRFSDLLEVDSDRVQLWLFARVATEARDDGPKKSNLLARRLARGR